MLRVEIKIRIISLATKSDFCCLSPYISDCFARGLSFRVFRDSKATILIKKKKKIGFREYSYSRIIRDTLYGESEPDDLYVSFGQIACALQRASSVTDKRVTRAYTDAISGNERTTIRS